MVGAVPADGTARGDRQSNLDRALMTRVPSRSLRELKAGFAPCIDDRLIPGLFTWNVTNPVGSGA
jgi:hypothetical protein